MLSYIDIIRDEMPPTRTYAMREVLFVPADERNPGDDGMGRLTLKLQHRRGHNRAYDLDSYRLVSDTPEPGDNGGRAFWLENIDGGEVYRCVVGGLNAIPRCNCKAGQCKVPGEVNVTDGCKHRDAVQHLITKWFI